ncbi:MAG: Rieske (2Fe-2S) protein [Cytophagales bacterium]|nr:Rieske (2Fe-2S) protein [Cytophagales bacterium]
MMNRKTFIKQAGAATALTALGISLESCGEEDIQPDLSQPLILDMSVSPFDEILSQNWVLHPDENVLIVNWEGEIRAFTSVCTHEQCARDWVFGRGVFTCTCHTSQFDYTGAVVSGPAIKNLAEFQVAREGNILTIS